MELNSVDNKGSAYTTSVLRWLEYFEIYGYFNFLLRPFCTRRNFLFADICFRAKCAILNSLVSSLLHGVKSDLTSHSDYSLSKKIYFITFKISIQKQGANLVVSDISNGLTQV